MASLHMTFIVLLAFLASFACAYDNSPMQDFCVAAHDAHAAVFVNGKVCKNPKHVKAKDFFFDANLHTPGGKNISSMGIVVNFVGTDRFPGLNTMGLSVARVDFAPNGLIQLHTHPRASEIVIVLEGTLYVGFVTSNPSNDDEKNTLFAKTLNPGDTFIIPMGLVHFLYNVGHTNAVVMVSYNSENPGFISIANVAFGSAPQISDHVLTKAFRLKKNVIDFLQSQTWPFL